MKHLLTIFAFTLIACSQTKTPSADNQALVKQVTIEKMVYNIKDTTCRLFIRHQECTECLDAWVDSGTVYLSDYP